MKENRLIIVIIVLIIILAGLVGVVAFMNFQNSDVTLFDNNSTNITNDSDVSEVIGNNSDENSTYSCQICGKPIDDYGVHLDGTVHSDAEIDAWFEKNHPDDKNDDSVVTTNTYRINKDGKLTNKQLNPNSDKYAYDKY